MHIARYLMSSITTYRFAPGVVSVIKDQPPMLMSGVRTVGIASTIPSTLCSF